MDLYQLRYFLEVARELNFTRAAENLHVSPPAVSRSVKLLEQSLKRKLFARTKRRVLLTADGDFLKARVAKLYDEIGRIELEFGAGRLGGPAMLKIGSREMITNYLLARPLAKFRRQYPETRLGLYALGPAELADALRKDQVDFGFYYSDVPDPEIEGRRLGRLRSHLYAAKSLIQGRAPKSFEDMLEFPFIAPRGFRADPAAPSPDGFPDRSFRRRIQYEAEFLETHRRFVLEGLAAAVLPDLTVQDQWRRKKIVRFEGPPIYRDIYFLKRKSRPLAPAADFLVAELRKSIQAEASY